MAIAIAAGDMLGIAAPASEVVGASERRSRESELLRVCVVGREEMVESGLLTRPDVWDVAISLSSPLLLPGRVPSRPSMFTHTQPDVSEPLRVGLARRGGGTFGVFG